MCDVLRFFIVCDKKISQHGTKTRLWTKPHPRLKISNILKEENRNQNRMKACFLSIYHKLHYTEGLLIHILILLWHDLLLLIIQYIIYWQINGLEALYNQWLCYGCCLVCTVAAWRHRAVWFFSKYSYGSELFCHCV